MRLPVIPIAVVVVLLGGAYALVTSEGPPTLVLGAPILTVLADIDGVETEVAIAPNRMSYAVIASGDLWLAAADGAVERLTNSPAAESYPAWTPDASAITFTQGPDTFGIDMETRDVTLYRENATHLTWSSGGRVAFVRDRALWFAEDAVADGRELVAADISEDTTIQSPRFSPSGERLIYLKSLLGLRGQVWVTDLTGLSPTPFIADRIAENPYSAEWVDEQHLVYVTDRSGGIAVWYLNLEDSTLVPLTVSLMGRSLAPLGLDVAGDRIVVPNHVIDSNVQTSSGILLAATPEAELDPAVSAQGNRIAFSVVNGDRFEIWVAASDGADPQYVTLGQHPRFAPNGNEIVYSNSDLDGNRDIWKVDIRTGIPVRLTDDEGIDDTPDWSPDGRTIIFSSELGGRFALWTTLASGGNRLRWNDSGYAPRFSPDAKRVTFWDDGQLWVANADGTSPMAVADVGEPAYGVWSGDGILYVSEGQIVGNIDQTALPARVMPVFDRLPTGEWLLAAAEAEATELWAIDLIFEEE